MKRIFYSLPGEGLGHAARTRAILDNLTDVEVHIFTWGEAYEFFSKQNYPFLHKIHGIPFGRDKNNKINIWKTIINFGDFLTSYRNSFNYIKKLCKKLNPSLFITDFEPLLPRVAKRCNKICISIDNQHKFSRCDSSDLPWKLRIYAYLMGLYTEWTIPNPRFIIVSTFYHSAIKKLGSTVLVNCFMRKSFEKYPPADEGYILVYFKSSCGSQILNILHELDQNNVKVYNCPINKQMYNFNYFDVSNEEFIRDLAGCSAIFCGSGNQLLGEATYYGKPIFTIPEPNQPEQLINAYYVDKMGYGTYSELKDLSPEKVSLFLDTFKQRNNLHENGAFKAAEIIKSFL